jgi:hypothetical protein
MGYLSKADILESDDLPSQDVDVPEWGGTVRVRGFSGAERDRFEFAMAAAKDSPEEVNIRAQVVGRCLIDADGKRLFTDKELVKLGAKSGAALDRVFDVVRELSGMGDKALQKATADFGNAPNDGSPTG